MENKPRKTRKDITIGNLEEKIGVPAGTIRNPDGSDARADQKLQTLTDKLGSGIENLNTEGPKVQSVTVTYEDGTQVTITDAEAVVGAFALALFDLPKR